MCYLLHTQTMTIKYLVAAQIYNIMANNGNRQGLFLWIDSRIIGNSLWNIIPYGFSKDTQRALCCVTCHSTMATGDGEIVVCFVHIFINK